MNEWKGGYSILNDKIEIVVSKLAMTQPFYPFIRSFIFIYNSERTDEKTSITQHKKTAGCAGSRSLRVFDVVPPVSYKWLSMGPNKSSTTLIFKWLNCRRILTVAHIESPMFNLGCHFDNRFLSLVKGRIINRSSALLHSCIYKTNPSHQEWTWGIYLDHVGVLIPTAA